MADDAALKERRAPRLVVWLWTLARRWHTVGHALIGAAVRYLNFELVIQARTPGSRTWSVFAQGARGESHLGVLDLTHAWARLQALSAQVARQATATRSTGMARSFMPEAEPEAETASAAQELGTLLYRAGFGGEVGEIFRAALREARGTGAGLRVRLRLQAVPELHCLPWEYLHDGRDFVGTDVRAPIVRYTEQARAVEPLTVQGPLRMLVVISSPADLGWLDAAAERDRIRTALTGLEDAGRLVIDVIEDGRWESLVAALSPGAGHDYHLLHFIGHGGVDAGSHDGQLLFTDAAGRAVAQDADSIATLLKNHESLKLVVLNACQGATASANDTFSSLAATLVDRAAPAVVAMQFAITDRAAIEFATTFYGMLAQGNPVETAVVMARVGEYARPRPQGAPRSLEWGTPVLYLRAAEGVLFDLLDAQGAPIRPVESRLPDGMAPYRGLACFDVEHAPIFLGRDAEIDALSERIEGGASLITVVAASGSGKSSLVRAGFLPRALAGAVGGAPWTVATLMPGARACEALAMALLKALPAARGEQSFAEASRALTEEIRSAREIQAFAASVRMTALNGLSAESAGLILVVDQLEEVFTLSSAAERAAFTRTLADAVDTSGTPVRVVLTLRADFTGHLLHDEHLGPLLEASAFYLRPMRPQQLRAVIERPAQLAGYRFEPGLVDELIDKVQGEPGHLALLAFVLDQLWARRDETLGVMRWEAYRALGGLHGAINAHAETVVQGLTAAQRALLRDVFGYLVRPGEGAEDTRTRVARRDLEDLGPDAGATVDALIAGRLLTARYDREASEDEVEVAHEALIREWSRLRRWIDAEREGLVLRQQIEQAAQLWRSHGEAAADLWRGVSLTRAVALRDAGRPPLSVAQRAFVDASEGASLAAARAVRRRRVWAVGALVVALIVAIGVAVGGFLLWDDARRAETEAGAALVQEAAERRRADAERDTAKAESLRARDAVRLFISEQARETDPALAALILAEAEDPGASALTLQPLVELAAQPGLATVVLPKQQGQLSSAIISPDGRRVVTLGESRAPHLWDIDGSRPPVRLEGGQNNFSRAVFTPDGRRLVGASQQTVFVWALDTGGPATVLGRHTRRVDALAISADGQRVLTVATGEAWLWHLGEQGPPKAFGGRGVLAGDISADGTRVATGSNDGRVHVWPVDDARPPVALEGHTAGVRLVRFSPAGDRILTVSHDKTVRVWNADGTGRPVVLEGDIESVWYAAFSPDGTRLLTTSDGGEPRIWRADGRGGPVVLKGHRSTVYWAAFSPDGDAVVTIPRDHAAWVWRADGKGRPVVLKGHTWQVVSAVFTPDGRRIVTASQDGTARVWQMRPSGRSIVLAGHDGPVTSATFSPEGTRIVTTSRDQTARVWRAEGGAAPIVLRGHTAPLRSAAFSADGQWIVTASDDETARIWRADGAGTPTSLRGHEGGVTSAAFSPDGARVVTASKDGTTRIWRVDGAGSPVVLDGHAGPVQSATFSPDGARVLTASRDGTVRIWSVDGSTPTVVLSGHRDTVYSARYSADGAHIITASADGNIRMHAADGTGAPRLIDARPCQARSAAFSPDGSRIVAACRGGTTAIWKVDDASRPLLLRGNPNGTVQSAVFSPDGTRVVTAFDNTARVWLVDGRLLQARLDRFVRRCLSPSLRISRLGESPEVAQEQHRACLQRKDLAPPPVEESAP